MTKVLYKRDNGVKSFTMLSFPLHVIFDYVVIMFLFVACSESQSRLGLGQNERVWLLASQSASARGQPGGRALLRTPTSEVSQAQNSF